MSLNKRSIWAGALFLLFWSALAAYTVLFPPPAGPPQLAYNPVFFPAILMALGAILALVIIVQGMVAQRREGAGREGAEDKHDIGRVLTLVVLIGLYFAGMPIVGFIPSSVLFIVIFTIAMRYRNWPAVIALAVVGPLAVWYLFTHGLQAPLPAFGGLP